jgi:hypothetical protein
MILAGGSRSSPYSMITAVSQQMLPAYDKPMLYYPPIVPAQAGAARSGLSRFTGICREASNCRCRQSAGIDPGDNIVYCHDLEQRRAAASARLEQATVFGYRVRDRKRYGGSHSAPTTRPCRSRKNRSAEIALCGDGLVFHGAPDGLYRCHATAKPAETLRYTG